MINVIVSKFGVLKNGEEVLAYCIKNDFLDLEILSYGGTIKSLKTPDKNGNFKNIVLGYESLKEYEEDQCHHACITGRIAGRTKDGVLNIKGKEYQLEKNSGNNNLHGGENGIDKKNWKGYIEYVDNRCVVLTLRYKSLHMEEGFPGEVDFIVKYIVRDNNVTIEYTGIPDRDTYINLTNHAYFNLSGDFSKTIENQKLKLYMDGYGEVNNETLPIKYEKENILIDKNKENILKDIFNSDNPQVKIVGGGIDHPFILSKDELIDGYLKDDESGRILKFKTDQPVVVVYTGNFLEKKHTGICFETQDYPDIFNFMPMKAEIHNERNIYYQKTTFIFEKEAQ